MCYRTGMYAVCRCMCAFSSPEISHAGAVNGLKVLNHPPPVDFPEGLDAAPWGRSPMDTKSPSKPSLSKSRFDWSAPSCDHCTSSTPPRRMQSSRTLVPSITSIVRGRCLMKKGAEKVDREGWRRVSDIQPGFQGVLYIAKILLKFQHLFSSLFFPTA